MSDATAIMQTEIAARRRYQSDLRFRGVAQSIVARVMQAHGPVDPERADLEASNIALDVCVMLLETVFREDAELGAMRAERDHFKVLAEQALRRSPMPPIMLSGVALTPGRASPKKGKT